MKHNLFNNVSKWPNIARWHLFAQGCSANGYLARLIVFNKFGWNKYCVRLEATLKKELSPGKR